MRTPRKWLRSVKRRKAGIYLVRTDKHFAPGCRENGYIGQSNYVASRKQDHLGRGRWGQTAKDWSDLNPVWHVLWLPWWLSWKWSQLLLEQVMILLTWPRYNVKGNRWNPRRVKPWEQANQRAARDGRPWGYRVRVNVAYRARKTAQLLGVLCILAGIVMSVSDRVS